MLSRSGPFRVLLELGQLGGPAFGVLLYRLVLLFRSAMQAGEAGLDHAEQGSGGDLGQGELHHCGSAIGWLHVGPARPAVGQEVGLINPFNHGQMPAVLLPAEGGFAAWPQVYLGRVRVPNCYMLCLGEHSPHSLARCFDEDFALDPVMRHAMSSVHLVLCYRMGAHHSPKRDLRVADIRPASVLLACRLAGPLGLARSPPRQDTRASRAVTRSPSSRASTRPLRPPGTAWSPGTAVRDCGGPPARRVSFALGASAKSQAAGSSPDSRCFALQASCLSDRLRPFVGQKSLRLLRIPVDYPQVLHSLASSAAGR